MPWDSMVGFRYLKHNEMSNHTSQAKVWRLPCRELRGRGDVKPARSLTVPMGHLGPPHSILVPLPEYGALLRWTSFSPLFTLVPGGFG